MTFDRKNTGKIGEDAACDYLKSKKYRIIERNFRISKIGEIDIIAEKIDRKWLIFGKKTLVFVEVKALMSFRGINEAAFDPENHINRDKISRLKRLGMAYLSQKNMNFDIPWQIDVIAVEIDGISHKVSKMRHHENIAYE